MAKEKEIPDLVPTLSEAIALRIEIEATASKLSGSLTRVKGWVLGRR